MHARALGFVLLTAPITTGVGLAGCTSGGSKSAAAGPAEPDLAPEPVGSASPSAVSGPRGSGKRELDEAKRRANADDLPGAIAQARAALEKNPQLEEGYLLLGSSCAMAEDTDCEKQAYLDGMAALPKSAAIASQMGLLELRLGDAKSALGRLEQASALAGGRDEKILADLAFAYTVLGRLEDAERTAKQASEVNPRSFEAAMSLGEVYLRKKDGEKAAAQFEAALERTEDKEVERSVTRQLAIAQMIAGRHERALELLRGLVPGADPGDGMLHAQIASNLMSLGRPKEAVTAMEAAVKTAPEDARFLSLLLQAQQKAGDKRGAEATKKRLVAQGVTP